MSDEARNTVPLDQWIDEKLNSSEAFRANVEAKVAAMRIEHELAAMREARGLSQRELARILGVTQPAVAKLESGRHRNIGVETLVRIITALGGDIKFTITRPPAELMIQRFQGRHITPARVSPGRMAAYATVSLGKATGHPDPMPPRERHPRTRRTANKKR